MTKTELAIKTYSTLLSHLQKVFIEGMQRIEEEKVKTYWRTGEIISNYILENKERADYGDNLFERLAEDLEIEKQTLHRAVKFYRAFPIVSAQTQLTWMHYRQLIYIEDDAKRNLFLQKAIRKEWGYRELEEAIRLDKLKVEEEPGEKPVQSSVKLSVTRSRLFTYQVLEPSYIHPVEEHLVIDLGFKFLIHAEVKGIRLKAEEIIESVKEGGVYSFKHSDAAKKELYTYKALVEKVIDGDTIWLNIDLGFSCPPSKMARPRQNLIKILAGWSRQKVRLRGIDCPELDTKKGQEAKALVEARLKEVDFVIVKTHKSDKYERYLADIFYATNEEGLTAVLEHGSFLNQELLDLGLAGIMED